MQFLTLNKGRSSTSFILNKGKKGKVTGGTVDTVKVDGKSVLQHPPMRRNLLKDDSNLSLIVGHNGGHLNKYNEELDRALAEVLDNIKNNFGEDYMIFANNDNFKNFLEGEINKVINRMKMNYSKISVNNVFVID